MLVALTISKPKVGTSPGFKEEVSLPSIYYIALFGNRSHDEHAAQGMLARVRKEEPRFALPLVCKTRVV